MECWFLLIGIVLYITTISWNMYLTYKYTKQGMIEMFPTVRKMIANHGFKTVVFSAIVETGIVILICVGIYFVFPLLSIVIIYFFIGMIVMLVLRDLQSIRLWNKMSYIRKNRVRNTKQRLSIYEGLNGDKSENTHENPISSPFNELNPPNE